MDAGRLRRTDALWTLRQRRFLTVIKFRNSYLLSLTQCRVRIDPVLGKAAVDSIQGM